jgi:hypothetical protein
MFSCNENTVELLLKKNCSDQYQGPDFYTDPDPPIRSQRLRNRIRPFLSGYCVLVTDPDPSIRSQKLRKRILPFLSG